MNATVNATVKAIRHIQIKKISPQLYPKGYPPSGHKSRSDRGGTYTAIITYETHPSSEMTESDDIESQKNLMNKLINDNWFVPLRTGEVNKPDPDRTPYTPDTYF